MFKFRVYAILVFKMYLQDRYNCSIDIAGVQRYPIVMNKSDVCAVPIFYSVSSLITFITCFNKNLQGCSWFYKIYR